MTNVVCNRFHPFNFGMIAPGNHLDLDSLRAAPPARYRSVVRKFGICRGKPGRRTTLSFRTSAHTGVGISIEFRTIYRHPFVGDGFPVPRNSETCMGRDGKPVPYDAFTVGPPNSNLSVFCFPVAEWKIPGKSKGYLLALTGVYPSCGSAYSSSYRRERSRRVMPRASLGR